jgi:hypothetical protein
MAVHYILMADVIRSREQRSDGIAEGLHAITSHINKRFKARIISPLTVTLGDEFQAILADHSICLEILIEIEEKLIQQGLDFKLRYVLLYGQVDTPVNKKIAHGMLGEGLTTARELLGSAKKTEDRFHILAFEEKEKINRMFVLFQSFIDQWATRDYPLIHNFLLLDDYKKVAQSHGKTWSQMWKRKKSLRIREYKIVRELIKTEEWKPLTHPYYG